MALVAGGVLLLAIGFSGGLLAGRGMGDLGDRVQESEAPVPAGIAAPEVAPVTQPVRKTGSAPVRIEPPVMDFGQVPPGAPVSGSVQIQNTGSAPLRIRQSRASCKCTSVDMANVVIPPGESVPMEASFDPGYSMGPKTAAVRILFEGYPDIVEVPVTANITMAVGAEPPFIDGISGDVLSGVYTVKSLDDAPFSILAVDGKSPPFVNFDPERDAPRSSYELGWDLTPYDPTTCFDADGNAMPVFLTVETDHPEAGVLDVQVRHTCTRRVVPPAPQDWVLSERRVMMGTLQPGESFDFELKMVMLPRRPDSGDRIRQVESESPDFIATIVGERMVGDEMLTKIRVTPTPGVTGLIRGELMVDGGQFREPLLIVGRINE
jgi:hypothetical protein